MGLLRHLSNQQGSNEWNRSVRFRTAGKGQIRDFCSRGFDLQAQD